MQIDKYIVNNIITCNVYGINGELLVGVGTPITDSIKKKLNSRKWYLDCPSDSIYENIALSYNEIYQNLTNSKIDAKLIEEKAKKIVELVINNPVIYSNIKKLRNYDEYTYNHCNNVACLAVSMGIRLGLNTHQLINIAIASLTHDIGKCMIDERIINKPGKLTDQEMELVRKHSQYGYDMMKNVTNFDESVLNAILYHHENYNGTGYPYGLMGDNIPIEASIIHVCDVFDALSSERPYKPKLSEYDSMHILKKERGLMFNPTTVDLFCSSIEIYQIGSIIELNDGTKVEITKIFKDDNGNVIKVEFKECLSKKILIIKK